MVVVVVVQYIGYITGCTAVIIVNIRTVIFDICVVGVGVVVYVCVDAAVGAVH